MSTRRKIFELVGESNYQDTLRQIWPGARLVLKPEPSNPHDPAAIRVDTSAGKTIGYLPRTEAAVLHPLLTRARIVKVHRVTGAVPEYPSIGCEISIAWDDKPEHPHKALAQDQLDHIGRGSARSGTDGGGLTGAIRRLFGR